MISYSKLLILRYQRPIDTLLDGWLYKSAIALIGTLWTLFLDVFSTNSQLILLLFVLLVIDFFTGLLASQRVKIPITSVGFRQTIVKGAEYCMILMIFAGVSNVFGEEIPYIETLVVWGYLFTIITEIKSIVENVSKGRDSHMQDVLEYVLKKLRKKVDGDLK